MSSRSDFWISERIYINGVLPRTQARSSGFENDWSDFDSTLRCFDTVFQRPYRDFSIALRVLSLSDRY